jgi:hypothetical protein
MVRVWAGRDPARGRQMWFHYLVARSMRLLVIPSITYASAKVGIGYDMLGLTTFSSADANSLSFV